MAQKPTNDFLRGARKEILLYDLKLLWWGVFWILLAVWVIVALLGFTGAIDTSGQAGEGAGFAMLGFLFVVGWIWTIMFVAWLLWGLVEVIKETLAKQKG